MLHDGDQAVGWGSLLTESPSLALCQTSTKAYSGQSDNLFPIQHGVFAYGKELAGFIFLL